ncbi:MAG: Rrf2 family transcriptional regulator [Candidatus Dadabacteria bacterium]|nr:MAG: Rrf2 family transcriptional regulator [Candidatus Dadabacteria bacterium]
MAMFVSRSLDYALRSLIVLAEKTGGARQSVSLRELSASASVPRSYLAKVMRQLVRGGIVNSDAGSTGGYRLAASPDALSLRRVYEVVEGNFQTVTCDASGRCDLLDDCTQVAVWNEIEEEILGVLDRRSLADFLGQSAEPALIGPEHIQRMES